MSNSFFKFKQFTIFQDQCAMKVCTDACLFGAWVANEFKAIQPERVLDIGTGTGLLSLMLAQQLHGNIETIEIEESAFKQATENIAASEFKERILVINGDVRALTFEHAFDLIISNPPFYEKDLRSPEAVTNMARHDDTLTLESLFAIVHSTLAAGGAFAVLIPYHRLAYCMGAAKDYKLYPVTIVNVQQTNTSGYFRSMIIFKTEKLSDIPANEIIIKIDHEYSDEFVDLLSSYYLML